MDPAPPDYESSLRASRCEGVAAQVTGSVIDHYLVPFALHVGVASGSIGLLIAAPSLLAAASQLFVVDAVRFVGSRRRLLVWGAAAQGLLLAPLPLLAVFPVAHRVPVILGLLGLYRIVGSMMGPAWGSLMSEYLPPERRGEYFGRRTQLIGVCGMLAVAAAGAALEGLKAFSADAAFALVFAAPAASRLLSCRWMARMADVPAHPEPREAFSPRAFWRKLRESNLVRFVAYVAGVTFSTHLCSAYFSVHLLQDLGADYLTYTAVHLGAPIAGFLSFPVWGRHADAAGNARILRLNSFLIPLIPLLWAATDRPLLLFGAEAFGGFVWAGFNLCASNFLYEAVAPAKRVRALAYFNLINGAAMFLGGSLGGWLSTRLPELWGYRLHSLFLVSAAARLAADLLLSGSFREVRPSPEPISSRDLFFSVLGLRALIGRSLEPIARLVR